MKISKFFDRFRKKKTCEENSLNSSEKNVSSSKPLKKSKKKREKDLIKWK